MGIQTKRSSLRSLPDARAGFAVSACSLGMPYARPFPYGEPPRTVGPYLFGHSRVTGAIKS